MVAAGSGLERGEESGGTREEERGAKVKEKLSRPRSPKVAEIDVEMFRKFSRRPFESQPRRNF